MREMAYTSGEGVGFAASGKLLGVVGRMDKAVLTLCHSVLDVVHGI